MKKYVVEISEKVTYNIEVDAVSSESAENIAREMYDSGIFEGEGEYFRCIQKFVPGILSAGRGRYGKV